MIQHTILLIPLLIPLLWCMDGILISSVGIYIEYPRLDCKSSENLLIDGKSYKSNCVSDGSQIYLTYENDTTPITDGKNITFLLELSFKDTNNQTVAKNYTGEFVPNRSTPNTLQTDKLNMTIVTTSLTNVTTTTEAPTTGTSKPAPPTLSTYAALTVNYIHLKFDENPKQVVKNSNGGAVAVAIIEGIALIAILAYMGYRIMMKQKKKEAVLNTAMYGIDNNSRITVPDSIRMNDIPPRRDPVYTTPHTPTAQPQQPTRTNVLTTQELVVPPNPTTATTSSTTQNGQFNDPFAGLDSW